MTHTQNSLSFEQALLDGMLCIQDGHNNILVGGADEEEHAIYNMKGRLKDESVQLASGASFFMLSGENGTSAAIRLADVGSFGLMDDSATLIMNFLASNNLPAEEIDLVLYSNTEHKKTEELKTIFGKNKILDYQKISGTYYTNSAFAMHYGIDELLRKAHPAVGGRVTNILVCNNLIPENLGLLLLDNKTN